MGIISSDQITIIDVTDAYVVNLSSDSYTFTGDTSGAPSGLSCSTTVTAYCGSTACSGITLTVSCPTGISSTVSDNDTASPTITFKTTDVITSSREATITVVIDDVEIKKKFTFAIAKAGAAGATGNGIASSAVTYQASTSGTTIPTGTWSSSIPSVSAGSYLWTRTIITYTNGSTTTSYSVGKMGNTGATGATGSAGKGVKSTAITYQAGSSQTSAPTGTWASSVPTLTTSLPYLWTRTIITYTDSTTSTSYSVSSTLESFEVGGRNLIKNSDFSNGTALWYEQGVTLTTATDDSTYGTYAKIVSTAAGSSDHRIYPNENTNFVHTQGKTYSLSFYAKGDDNSVLRISVGGGSQTIKEFALTGNWKRFTVVYTANVAYSLTFWLVEAGTFYLTDVKLESGNKATDWSPAPEDTDAAIEEVRTETTAQLNILEDEINANVKETSALGTRMSTVEQNATSLTTTVSSLTGRTDTLESSMTTVQQTATSLTSSVSNLDGRTTTLEQTVDGFEVNLTTLKNTVDNMQIGGRNLAERTGNHTSGFYGSYAAGTYTFSQEKDSFVPSGICDKFVWTAAPTTGGPYIFGAGEGSANYISKMKSGETITVSLWIKCSGAKSVNNINCEFLKDVEVIQKSNLSTSWQRVILRGTYNGNTETALAITFYNGSNIAVGNTLYISSLKVEKGNIATDWTPAPEDSENGTEIGGKNLLYGTKNFSSDYFSTIANGSSAIGTATVQDDNSLYIVNTSSNIRIYQTRLIKIYPNVNYTISVKYKPVTGTVEPQFWLYAFDSSASSSIQSISGTSDLKYRTLDDGWTLMYRTFSFSNAEARYLRAYLLAGAFGYTYTNALYFKELMLEQSTYPSSWSPAPEEVDSDISNAAKTATNYLSFGSAGLVVGNMTASNLGNNVLIDSDSVDIRSGSTVLASYGSSYIYLGKNSSSTTINLCNGSATMTQNTEGSYKYFNISASDSLSLGAVNTISLCSQPTSTTSRYAILNLRSYSDTSGSNVSMQTICGTGYYTTFSLDSSTYYSTITLGIMNNSTGSFATSMAMNTSSTTITGGFAVTGGWASFGSRVLFGTDAVFENNMPLYGKASDGTFMNMAMVNTTNDIVLGYGSYTTGLGDTYLYGDNIYLRSALANASFTPYYKEGDSITLLIYTSGYISGSSSVVEFLVPLSKPVIGTYANNSITVTSNSGLKVRRNGVYVYGSSSSAYVKPSSMVGWVTGSGTCVRIRATMSNTTNAAANYACGVEASIIITIPA